MLQLAGVYNEQYNTVTISLTDGDFAANIVLSPADAMAVMGMIDTLLTETIVSSGKSLWDATAEKLDAENATVINADGENPNKGEIGS